MRKKIKNWLINNKKDLKRLLIGGVILSILILLLNTLGQETDVGIAGAFFGGIFLTAIYINAYRFWRKIFDKIKP